MAIFPALEPNTRSYNFGQFPLMEQPSQSAGIVRFRHGSNPQSYELNLGYIYLTDSQAAEIRTHFQGQGGTYRSFTLPSAVLKGHTFTGNVFPTGTRWRYAVSPDETHHENGRYSLTVSLLSDGELNPDSLGVTQVAFTGGLARNIPGGLQITVTASILAGNATGT